MDRYQQGETARLNVAVVDSGGAGITGMTVAISIRKHDGKWWNNAGYFQVPYTETNMTTVDATYRPGQYEYVFNPRSLTDFHVSFLARVTAGAGTPANGPFMGDAIWGYWIDDLATLPDTSASVAEILKRIGGDIIETRLRQIVALLDYIRQKMG